MSGVALSPAWTRLVWPPLPSTLALPEAVAPGPPPAALPYPILRGLSRPRGAALRLAPGRAARAVGTAWPPAGGAGGHAPEGAAQKCLLNFLSAVDALKEKSEKYSKRHISCSEIDALVGKFHVPDNSSLNLCSSPLKVEVQCQP